MTFVYWIMVTSLGAGWNLKFASCRGDLGTHAKKRPNLPIIEKTKRRNPQQRSLKTATLLRFLFLFVAKMNATENKKYMHIYEIDKNNPTVISLSLEIWKLCDPTECYGLI